MEQREIIGYKAAYQQENCVAKCRDLEIYPNTTIEVEGTIKICKKGLHYCPKIEDVFKYYHLNGGKVVVFEVLSHGKQHQIEDDKCCSNSLVIGNIVNTFEKYDDAWSFQEGRAKVKKNGKYGFIDINGTEVVPFIYDEAWSFSEGRAEVKKDDKWGYVDLNGNEIIE